MHWLDEDDDGPSNHASCFNSCGTNVNDDFNSHKGVGRNMYRGVYGGFMKIATIGKIVPMTMTIVMMSQIIME